MRAIRPQTACQCPVPQMSPHRLFSYHLTLPAGLLSSFCSLPSA